MKHQFSETEADVIGGTPAPIGRRARKHTHAIRPLQTGELLLGGGARDRNNRFTLEAGEEFDESLFGSTPGQLRTYIFGLTIIPPRPTCAAEEDPLLNGIRDAADECKHGRLPGDSSKPCMCWGGA